MSRFGEGSGVGDRCGEVGKWVKWVGFGGNLGEMGGNLGEMGENID